MRLALNACRAATRLAIDLPDDESVELLFRPNTEWDGYARYLGQHRSQIAISETPLDISRAFHLACHEAYPGHHVQFVLRTPAPLSAEPRPWSAVRHPTRRMRSE